MVVGLLEVCEVPVHLCCYHRQTADPLDLLLTFVLSSRIPTPLEEMIHASMHDWLYALVVLLSLVLLTWVLEIGPITCFTRLHSRHNKR